MIEIKIKSKENFGDTKIAINQEAEVSLQVSGNEYEVVGEMVALLDAIARNKNLDVLWLRAMQLHMESMK